MLFSYCSLWLLQSNHCYAHSFIGLERNRHNLDKNQSSVTGAATDKSGYTCISSDICDLHFSQVINERKEQEDKDFQLALKLQKEFDLASKKAAQVERKKGTVDAYLLRNVNQSETSKNSDNSSRM